MAAPKKTTAAIMIPSLNVKEVEIWVQGTDPYIANRFSNKAKAMIMAGQLGLLEASMPREAKDPIANFEACIHRMPGGAPAIPAAAFKSAMISAIRMLKGSNLTMAGSKQMFIMPDRLLRLYGDPPRMCEHIVRNQSGVVDVRHRALFLRWQVCIRVSYVAESLSNEQIATLAQWAGFGCGVGDWRPSAPESTNGQCGRFTIVSQSEADAADAVVGDDYTAQCLADPPDNDELEEVYGVVPDETLELYRKAAEMNRQRRESGEDNKGGKGGKKGGKKGTMPTKLEMIEGIAKRGVQ